MNDFAKGIGYGVLFVSILSLVMSFYAWIVMLASGAIGHVFDIRRMFIGFWPDSFIVSVALSVLGSFFRSSRG